MAKPVKKKTQATNTPAAAPSLAPPPIAPASPVEQRLFWAIAAGLVVACFLIYAQVGSHEFINYDDPNYVINNVNVNRGVTANGIA